MEYAVGDKVVHPYHGPGLIAGVVWKELLDGKKRYYVIDIPAKELVVHVPWRKIDQAGVRPAMSRAKLARVMDRLRSAPRCLPQDYKERQADVWEQLRTGRVMQIAEVVRDLAWHKELEHLTRKDTEYLERGRRYLAAEMALVSGTEVSDMEQRIETILDMAMAEQRGQERHQPGRSLAAEQGPVRMAGSGSG